MNEPILCYGSGLFTVLDDLRERGVSVESVDIGIGGNSGYRVNYFGQVVERKDIPEYRRGSCDTRVAPHVGSNPTLSANLGFRAPIVGESSEVPGCKTSGMTVAANLTHEKRGNSVQDRPGGVESADLGRRDDLSIEDRMAALRERLVASGKLQRSNPSTPPEHARLPYKDQA